MSQQSRLPDHIQLRGRILFVGINPGRRSAETGHHYAGASNRFWKLLYESALISEPLTYQDDWRLPEWGLGLTNMISRCSAGSGVLAPHEYRAGLGVLARKVRRYRPQIVALLGVTIYRMIFAGGSKLPSRLDLGLTESRLAGVPIFLLPNPSGRNAHYSYRQMLEAFQALNSCSTAMAAAQSSTSSAVRRRPVELSEYRGD